MLRDFDVEPIKGLSASEVKRRLKKYGPNRLREAKEKSALVVLINQFKSLIVILLAAAALVSFVFGDNDKCCSVKIRRK